MSRYDPDDMQTKHYTRRGAGQKHTVPQTTMSEGYDNNHVKYNSYMSDSFANDSNDAAMRHNGRFTKTYPSAGKMNKAGNMRFVSRKDER
jgi:hypothetical protein